MQPNDLSPADLGSGYTLSFQERPVQGDCRAIVKNAQGEIIVRGPVFPKAQAFRSRLAVVISPESYLWLPGAKTPSNNFIDDLDDLDSLDEDEDEEEEEEEE